MESFNAAVARVAAELGQERALVEALAVGRFKNGTPLATRGEPSASYDPRNDEDFDYDDDPSGSRCPLHAHIRKTNPRGSLGFLVNLLAREQERRIARRGITYTDGPEQKGLLFLCYQSDIRDQFEFLQASWANNPEFSRPRTGLDPVIGQAGGRQRREHAPSWPRGWVSRQRQRIRFDEHVRLLGGEYFFAPSLSGLRALAGRSGQPGGALRLRTPPAAGAVSGAGRLLQRLRRRRHQGEGLWRAAQPRRADLDPVGTGQRRGDHHPLDHVVVEPRFRQPDPLRQPEADAALVRQLALLLDHLGLGDTGGGLAVDAGARARRQHPLPRRHQVRLDAAGLELALAAERRHPLGTDAGGGVRPGGAGGPDRQRILGAGGVGQRVAAAAQERAVVAEEQVVGVVARRPTTSSGLTRFAGW